MVDRMVRATKGEIALYEEVEESTALTQEAYTIVGIVAALNAVGLLVGGLLGGLGAGAILPAVVSGISVVVGYVIWAYGTFFVGTRFFGGQATPGEMMRAIGYAYTPLILVGILGAIPILGCLSFIPYLWSIYLGFVAVRQGLDLDNQKALLTVVIAFIPVAIIIGILASIAGLGAAAGAAVTGS